MAKLSHKVRSMIARQVKNRGVVVWYDPEKAYTRLVQDLDLTKPQYCNMRTPFFAFATNWNHTLNLLRRREKPGTDAVLHRMWWSMSPWNGAKHILL